jgi:hypothetical protein
MQNKVRDWIIDISVVLGGIGGLACILLLFDVKPKDVRINPPHWAWLVGALALVAFNTWQSFRPSARKREQLKLAGVIESKGGQARWLLKRLEKVWHVYNNENIALAHPLSEATLAETAPIAEYRERELFAFRIAYRGHIGQIAAHLPDFNSEIMQHRGFWNIDYSDLQDKLTQHADKLTSLAHSTERKL